MFILKQGWACLFGGLMLLAILIFGRTRIWFRPRRWYWMPLPLAAFLTSLFLWLAENIGTLTGTWLYAGQSALDHVSFAKIGSWYLLLYVSFVTVTIATREAIQGQAPAPAERGHRFGEQRDITPASAVSASRKMR